MESVTKKGTSRKHEKAGWGDVIIGQIPEGGLGGGEVGHLLCVGGRGHCGACRRTRTKSSGAWAGREAGWAGTAISFASKCFPREDVAHFFKCQKQLPSN